MDGISFFTCLRELINSINSWQKWTERSVTNHLVSWWLLYITWFHESLNSFTLHPLDPEVGVSFLLSVQPKRQVSLSRACL